jgi:hypothetical protein
MMETALRENGKEARLTHHSYSGENTFGFEEA